MSSSSSLSSLTPAELRKAAVILEQIEALNHELAGVLGSSLASAPQSELEAGTIKTRKKYKLTAKGRAKMVAAIKERWKKVAKAAKTEAKSLKNRGKVSAERRARIAAAKA